MAAAATSSPKTGLAVLSIEVPEIVERGVPGILRGR
jgi:hypothetical protein